VFIVVLGAGDVGGAVAQQLGTLHLGMPVVIVDARRGVAEGKALDLRQSAPVDGSASDLSGTDDAGVLANAALVIIADGEGDPGRAPVSMTDAAVLPQLTLIARHSGRVPVLCATHEAATIIERAVTECGLAPSRMLGSAPEALRGALRALIARECGCRPGEVAVAVLGRAPGQLIVPWDGCSIGGRNATDVLAPPTIRRIEAQLSGMWPPGPHALGRAAARTAAGLLRGDGEVFVVQVALVRGVTGTGRPAILPAMLGPEGVRQVTIPTLTARDRVRLDAVVST
jgi:malate dehydrogenase